MSNAIVTLIIVAILLVGVSIMAQTSFKSMDALSDAWKQMEVRSTDIAQTKIEVINKEWQAQLIQITVKNSGQISLLDFASWDVIVQYYQSDGVYHQIWLPYTTVNPPANNQWTVLGIYLNAGLGTPETFQPNIFNPGEEMIIRLKVSPAASQSYTNQVIIGTAKGVSVSTFF